MQDKTALVFGRDVEDVHAPKRDEGRKDGRKKRTRISRIFRIRKKLERQSFWKSF
jgi:hypothetical protein